MRSDIQYSFETQYTYAYLYMRTQPHFYEINIIFDLKNKPIQTKKIQFSDITLKIKVMLSWTLFLILLSFLDFFFLFIVFFVDFFFFFVAFYLFPESL